MSTGPSGRRLSHFTPGLRENEYGRVLNLCGLSLNVLAIVVVDFRKIRNSGIRRVRQQVTREGSRQLLGSRLVF
jgi:hypothetical protein